MDDNPRSDRTALPGWLERLENADPYVALRLAILQAGIGIALVLNWGTLSDLPEILDFFPLNLGSLVPCSDAYRFTYPVRELVWAGDYWRIGTGVFLPAGLGISVISFLAWFPIARILESEVGHRIAFLVYLLGGFSAVLVDLVVFPGTTSGGMGMVFATFGAVGAVNFSKRRISAEAPARIPWQVAFVLFLLLLSCAIPYNAIPTLPVLLADHGLSLVTPSWSALAAATFSGIAAVLPIAARRYPVGNPPPSGEKAAGDRQNVLPWAFSVFWWGAFAGVLAFWQMSAGEPDYRIWRNEPDLIAGNEEALEELEGLLQTNPGDLFLKKRKTVYLLRRKEWRQAAQSLESLIVNLKERSGEAASDFVTPEFSRRLRLIHLNLRAADVRLPWRYSGISENYAVDSLRLLQDQAHLARLMGDAERLKELRKKVLAVGVEKVQRFNVRSASMGVPLDSDFSRARLLNVTAYERAELDGDLGLAIEEASTSISLHPDYWNLDTLGWVEVKLGLYRKALGNLRKAAEWEEGFLSGTILYHLGVAYDELGEKEEARTYFHQALERDLMWWEEVDLFSRCPDCHPLGNIAWEAGLDARKDGD